MVTNESLELFFQEYEDIISNGLEYNYSEKEICDAIYSREFNKYLRKGIHPRLDELSYVVNFVREFRSEELEVKLQSGFYKWNSESDACHRCNELNGQIFDYLPQRPHPHCNCEVESISEQKYNNIKRIHEENLRKRDNAVNYLTENAKQEPPKKGDGECARYVTNALEKSGINLRQHQNKNEKDYYKAYKYGEYLEKENFQNIKTGQGEILKSYNPQAGDVIIFDKSDKQPEGHMQMYNGQYWISDYKQNTEGGKKRGGNGFFPSQSYKDENSFTIYRNPDWLNWEIDKGN